jgi:hypothetical protein
VAGIGIEKATVIGVDVVLDRAVGAKVVRTGVEGAGVAGLMLGNPTCWELVW